jgi:hypothetical protein
MVRRFKTRGIKSNKAYEVHELADAACVTPATVRNWFKDGMGRIDDTRPTMILGFQALDYLNSRKTKGKRPMQVGEFYCLRCKAARMPFGAMADYVPISTIGGHLKALCGVCECNCNRNIRASELPALSKVLEIEIRGVPDA